MRLIDADELIKGLKEDFDDCDIQKDLEFFGIYDYIKEQPTAYDVDKVVEEMIKEFKKYYGNNWDKAPYLVRTVEIVERGGVSESKE
jgi:hypothetical protein